MTDNSLCGLIQTEDCPKEKAKLSIEKLSKPWYQQLVWPKGKICAQCGEPIEDQYAYRVELTKKIYHASCFRTLEDQFKLEACQAEVDKGVE